MIYDSCRLKERLFQRPYLNGLINLNRPFDTRSNSSLVPLGFPCRCLYKKALYVPFPKPRQAFIKSLHENGSEREPFLTASIIALYTRWLGINCLYEIALSPLPLLRSHIDCNIEFSCIIQIVSIIIRKIQQSGFLSSHLKVFPNTERLT